MEATGYSTNASRSPEDIAATPEGKAGAGRDRARWPQARRAARIPVARTCRLKYAPARLLRFADRAGLKLDDACRRFDARVAALANAGVDLTALT